MTFECGDGNFFYWWTEGKPILKDEIKILKSYELPNDASNDWIASQRFSQRN